MQKLQQRKSEGFTIVETLIVLAIVGVMMLVVFLAVPALQRNSRNTGIKNDVQNLLAGVSEFQSNNNGSMPTGASGTGSITITDGTNNQTTSLRGATQVTSGTTAPGTGVPTAGNIYLRIGTRCDLTASSRAVAAYYLIETSGGTSSKCQDS